MRIFKLIALLALVGLIVSGSMTSRNHRLLFSDHAPAGIISLELTHDPILQYQIFSEWNRPENYIFIRDWKDSVGNVERISGQGQRATIVEPGEKVTGVETARRQTLADYGFIFFYVFSSILLFWYFYKYSVEPTNSIQHWQFLLFTPAVSIAGLLDLIENHFLLKSISLFLRLNPQEVSPACLSDFLKVAVAGKVFYPALFKITILGLTAIYFGWVIGFFPLFTRWLVKRSKDIFFGIRLAWTFRIVILVLFVLFALLNFSDQGQDLLVTINTSEWGTAIFLFSISVMASLNWYLPKLYDGKFTDLSLTVPKGFALPKRKVDYARLLGAITFLIPATALLSTMQHYHISYFLDAIPTGMVLLLVLIGYHQLLAHKELDKFFLPNGTFLHKRYYWVMVVIFALITLFYFAKNNEIEQHGRLSFLALDLFLLSFAFLLTVTYRSQLPLFSAVAIAPFILVSGVLLAIVFLLFNIPVVLFSLTADFRFFTLAVVIAALVGYLLIFSYLLVLGKRTDIQWITLILLGGFVMSYMKISDFHKVYTLPAKGDEPTMLADHIYKWLKYRQQEIKDYPKKYNTPYPVYFLNSYGGGIRASVWATMVVGELDSLVLSVNKSRSLKDDFQHHVFSFSGASGGTIGFSLLAADRIGIKDSLITGRFFPDSAEVYQHDYLTANVTGIFGRDMLMSITGRNWYDDRSRLQERGFEKILCEQFNQNYSIPLRKAWDGRQLDVPLLFSNTYDINTGKKGITVAVKLEQDDFPSSLFIQDLLKKNHQDLPLSAAAFLSARFPFVCPTGKFDEKHHFTDGGTLENSGAETSAQVIAIFRKVLAMKEFQGMDISINLLSISNSLLRAEHPVTEKNLFEVFAPLSGLLETISSNAVKADEVNRVMVERELKEPHAVFRDTLANYPDSTQGITGEKWSYNKIQPTPEMINGNWPVLPLGWQISDDALSAMRKSIHKQRTEFLYALKPFGTLTQNLQKKAVFAIRSADQEKKRKRSSSGKTGKCCQMD